jgi:hypothetical protein
LHQDLAIATKQNFPQHMKIKCDLNHRIIWWPRLAASATTSRPRASCSLQLSPELIHTQHTHLCKGGLIHNRGTQLPNSLHRLTWAQKKELLA